MTIKFEQSDIQANNTNVLNQIVTDKHNEVTKRAEVMPLYAIEPGLEASSRSFFQSLKSDYEHKGAGFILEIKKASPSKGLIRENFDLKEICEAYQDYASCVSVLTDEKYFQGDFERLPLVREILSQPLLCKDFFVDPYQVYLARFYGADAILLMLSVLDDETYLKLASVAKQYDMDILTEVSNEQEMQRAVNLNADIIGINNRNLRDLTTDLAQTPKLIELFEQLADKKQQENTLLISESGIYTHQQVKQLSTKAHGFLVGSSLMAKKDLKQACRQLIVGEIKVCGITNSEDLIALQSRDIDYAGLITVPESKRYVSDSQIKALLEESLDAPGLTALKTKIVLVTRDLDIDEIIKKVTQLPIFAIQLHGNEDQDYINRLRQEIANKNIEVQVWKAVGVTHSINADQLNLNVDKFVFDTKGQDGQSGGTGQTFNWSALSELENQLTMPAILIAGGLNETNAIEARNVLTNGFDLNSGVEASVGKKSEQKIDNVLTHLIGRYEA